MAGSNSRGSREYAGAGESGSSGSDFCSGVSAGVVWRSK